MKTVRPFAFVPVVISQVTQIDGPVTVLPKLSVTEPDSRRTHTAVPRMELPVAASVQTLLTGC